MWTEILGEDIYRMIDKEYCRLLVEKEEKLLRQGMIKVNYFSYFDPINYITGSQYQKLISNHFFAFLYR